MRIEKRDLIRWFKQGWVFVILTTVINLVITNFGVASVNGLIDQITANPTGALSGLLAIGLIGLVWALIAFPIIAGWLIEEIAKRVKK